MPRRSQSIGRAVLQAVVVATPLLVGWAPPASSSAASVAVTATELPSWNDSAARSAIQDFVKAVSSEGSADFVPASERIAVFDNDGTLWSEQPEYFQLLFARDRVRAMAPDHPEWKNKEPFKSVLAGDTKRLEALAEKGLMDLVEATHAGMTVEQFHQVVRSWMAEARHPTTKRPFTQMVYQPMLELLTYLRANGFKTFIVSGGGAEFIRAWAEQVYGVPPEQIVGSRGKLAYESRNGMPAILKRPEVEFVDDGPEKPVGIAQMIGRRPIAAFGNSDGDFQMLEYATAPPGRRLGVLVHHTDADREWAYDRGSRVGKLQRGLDEAAARGWILLDMKKDWNVIHPAKSN